MIDGHVQLAVGHSPIGTHYRFVVGAPGNGHLEDIPDLPG
jgi:hypothetical protein